MKITREKLKQIIKEELDNVQIDKAIEDKATPIAKILFDQGVGPDPKLHQHLMNYFRDILQRGLTRQRTALPHRDAFSTPEAFEKANPNALQSVTAMVKELDNEFVKRGAESGANLLINNLASYTRDAINKLFLARKKE